MSQSSSQSPLPPRRFKLLVMLLLLALLGILAYVLLARYYEGRATATVDDPELARFELDAQIQSLEPVRTAMEAYYRERQQWPSRLEQLPLDSGLLRDFKSLRLENGGRLSFLGSESLGPYQQHRVYLEPQGTPDSDGFDWRCTGPRIPQPYLPPYCTGQGL